MKYLDPKDMRVLEPGEQYCFDSRGHGQHLTWSWEPETKDDESPAVP